MKKVKVLLLAANPEEKNLRLAAEQRGIRECVELSERQFQKAHPDRPLSPIEFIPISAARIRDLPRMLALHGPQVLHFSGHGASGGEILFETPTGQRAAIPPALLGRVLTPFSGMLRLVLLNACYSQDQAQALIAGVDCCIGLSKAIEDEVALLFAQAFYDLVALGMSVGHAFHCACQELTTLGDGESWADAPRLHCRDGVNANQVFLHALAAPPHGAPAFAFGGPCAAADSAPTAEPGNFAPALQRLDTLPTERLSIGQLRRAIDQLLLADAELSGFLRSKYPASAQQIGDNMQRASKLNILFTYEADLGRLRRRLIDYCRDETS